MISISEDFKLVPIQETDAWRLCDFVVSNEDRLRRWFPKTLEQNLNPEISKIFVDIKTHQFLNQEEFFFLLKPNDDHEIAGLVIIKNIDWRSKKAELAYCIGYRHEGKNIMTAAVKAITDYCFDQLKLHTLEIISHNSNGGSIRVAEKSGFQFASVLKNEFAPPGEPPLDMQLYERKSLEGL